MSAICKTLYSPTQENYISLFVLIIKVLFVRDEVFIRVWFPSPWKRCGWLGGGWRGNYSSFISIHFHIITLHYYTFSNKKHIDMSFIANSWSWQDFLMSAKTTIVSHCWFQTRALLEFEPLLKLNEGSKHRRITFRTQYLVNWTSLLLLLKCVFSPSQVSLKLPEQGTHIYQQPLGGGRNISYLGCKFTLLSNCKFLWKFTKLNRIRDQIFNALPLCSDIKIKSLSEAEG